MTSPTRALSPGESVGTGVWVGVGVCAGVFVGGTGVLVAAATGVLVPGLSLASGNRVTFHAVGTGVGVPATGLDVGVAVGEEPMPSQPASRAMSTQ